MLTAASGAAPAEDAGPASRSNVRIEDERAAAAVRRAVAGASERLKEPACQALLYEFRDASGRRLHENLEATGQSSERYLATRVFFYEGYRLPTCRSRRATKGLAVTQPGSRAVFVCTTRFTDLEKRSPAEAQAVVIHELLHTLGLGENPPASDEITAAVIEACAVPTAAP
jgi:hypothetical protein